MCSIYNDYELKTLNTAIYGLINVSSEPSTLIVLATNHYFLILGEMFLEPLIAGREQRFSSLRRQKFHPPISSLLGCSAMPTAVQDYVLIGRSTAIYC